MDIYTYFQQREREIEELSLVPDREAGEMYFEEAGSEGQRGRIFGQLILDERTFLQIHERVEVANEHVHRTEYAYFLVMDGAEVWGYERDPSHAPPVHRHTRGHKREEAERITFNAAAELAWEEVSRREGESPDEAI